MAVVETGADSYYPGLLKGAPADAYAPSAGLCKRENRVPFGGRKGVMRDRCRWLMMRQRRYDYRLMMHFIGGTYMTKPPRASREVHCLSQRHAKLISEVNKTRDYDSSALRL